MALVTCQECALCSFGLNGCDHAQMICVQRVVFRHRWCLFLHPLSAPLGFMAFKQHHGVQKALLPRALCCLSVRGCCELRVGRSVIESGVQGSVVVVSAEQEASAATGLQYTSYTSICQFTLNGPEMSLKPQHSSHYSPGMTSDLLLGTSESPEVLSRHSAKHAP